MFYRLVFRLSETPLFPGHRGQDEGGSSTAPQASSATALPPFYLCLFHLPSEAIAFQVIVTRFGRDCRACLFWRLGSPMVLPWGTTFSSVLFLVYVRAHSILSGHQGEYQCTFSAGLVVFPGAVHTFLIGCFICLPRALLTIQGIGAGMNAALLAARLWQTSLRRALSLTDLEIWCFVFSSERTCFGFPGNRG